MELTELPELAVPLNLIGTTNSALEKLALVDGATVKNHVPCMNFQHPRIYSCARQLEHLRNYQPCTAEFLYGVSSSFVSK